MRRLWDKIVSWLHAIPEDKRMHFVCGFIIAAFFCIVFGMKLCFIPALIAGAAKELYDKVTTKVWEWKDFLATCLGGLLCQVFVLLNIVFTL